MPRTCIVSVPMDEDLKEVLDARRGPLSRSAFIRRILEEAVQSGARVVVDVGRVEDKGV